MYNGYASSMNSHHEHSLLCKFTISIRPPPCTYTYKLHGITLKEVDSFLHFSKIAFKYKVTSNVWFTVSVHLSKNHFCKTSLMHERSGIIGSFFPSLRTTFILSAMLVVMILNWLPLKCE